ncbi:MAG: hypothetical protein LBH37_04425 [Oscillospiraceae bacterium]|jgi:UDP-N-acetyl-D-galactosamine dehydrogenase|nr:hypothetical protein [Oscillospiraceae bacterium]
MDIYNDILNNNKCISVIGLGYVGISIATEFAKKCNVIGFDIDSNKINNYKKGIDPTNEIRTENF